MGRIRVGMALLVLFAVTLVSANGSMADEEPVIPLSIPASNLDQALNELARQSGTQLLFPYDVARQLQSPTVQGRYTVTEALALMLQGTQLESRITGSGVIAISLSTKATEEVVGTNMDNQEITPVEKTEEKRGFFTRMSTAILAAWIAAPANAQDAEDSLALEEVVVTAQRRGAENVMDVPLAVTAFGGDWIEDRGFQGLDDFIQMTPSTSITESIPGFSRIQMRGISAGVGENNVGFYLDEIPIAYINQSALPDVRSFDLDRVEVLRGPQSTLYGAGALAGVVRTITRDPALDAFGFKGEFEGSTTDSGGGNYAANVALNAPIVTDRFAARLVYSAESEEGWIDETVLGKKNYNDTDTQNFRLKLLGQVTDNLVISGMYWGSRIETDGVPFSYIDRTNDDAADTTSNFDYDVFNLTIKYDGANFGLVSSTSQMELDTELVSDFLFGYTLESLLDPKTFTQEFRLFSNTDSNWQWTAGGYYRDADQTQIQQSDVLVLFGLDPVIQYDKVESWNVFAELTRIFMDGKLEATIGARYIDETRSSEQRVRPSEPYENDFNETTPRFNLTYRPADNWMTYFNYGEGFRSGINQFAISLETAAALGVILPSAAEPESADSYELGLKGSFLNDRLTVDAALFYIDYTDLQTIIPIVAGVLSGAVNAAKAESPGVELALNWMATERLRLGVMGSWNDSHIVGDVFAEATVLDPVTGLPTGVTVPIQVFADGDRLNDVPEWTAAATVDYVRPMSSNMDLVIRGSAQYTSAREQRSFGTIAVGDDVMMVDARVGLDFDRWGAYLFARNLFDEDGVIGPDLSIPNYGTRYRPRTVGVNVRFSF